MKSLKIELPIYIYIYIFNKTTLAIQWRTATTTKLQEIILE